MLQQTKQRGGRLGWKDRRNPSIEGQMNLWKNGLTGPLLSNSEEIAANFLTALNRTSYRAKIVHFNPLLGANLNASLRSLIGTTSTQANMVDADFSQSTGWKGNGSNKIVDTGVLPSSLGTSGNGGIFYWEMEIDATGTTTLVMGMMTTGNSNRYCLDLRTAAAQRNYMWGSSANSATQAVVAANGFYLGQRASATSRELFFDDASVATNTTSDAATGSGDFSLRVLGSNNSGSLAYNKSRCGLFGMTDGTMTADEVAAFYILLRDYIMRPTGRITT